MIIGALLIVVFIIGCAVVVASDSDVQDAADVLSDEPGVVRVRAPAGKCWSGAFGDRTVEGCGNRNVRIEEDIIVANAQKQGAGRWPLTLVLVVGGEEKDRTSTTAQYGVVSVSEG